MKRSSPFGWVWAVALVVIVAISFNGCRTSSQWRANSPQGDPARVSKGEGMGALAPASEVLPCPFG